MSWGGRREGAGRKVGWRKPEGTRDQHQIRAYPDEWQIIKAFADEVKHGDKQKCFDFIQSLD